MASRALRVLVQVLLPFRHTEEISGWFALIPYGGVVLAAVIQIVLDRPTGEIVAVAAISLSLLAFWTAYRLQEKLDYTLDIGSRQRSIIDQLTGLATEGARLAEHEGARPHISVFLGEEETEADRQFWAKRNEYSRLVVEWGQKVRSELDVRAPEFLADWDAAKKEDRFELLREIIREIRGKL